MNRLSSQGGTTARRTTFLASNPVMRRLGLVNEVDETDSAAYGGIVVKTAFFLLMTVVGVAVHLLLMDTLAVGKAFPLTISRFETTLYPAESIAFVVVLILGVVLNIVACLAQKTTPVTGSLYCITQGYVISFLVFRVLKDYEYIGVLALALTLLIILIMAILYTTGAIRVTKKFRMVLTTLMFGMVGISILTLIASFIPLTQPLVAAIRGNLGISILFSAVYIIIAALFLVSDFDMIDRVVTNRYPKKYEWSAAFGLAFTMIWLYLKVLDLLMKILGGQNNRSRG
jgi:uncharacterized YccA/Bax inhibitor family protein